jgi:multiple RNA-binding domain-containing protein 1
MSAQTTTNTPPSSEQKPPVVTSSSRLIVKNIPRHLTEERLKEFFGKQGKVTDAKIMRKNDKSRNFAFVGYKTEAEAAAAKKFFDGTFFDTSKMVIEFARP